MKHASVFCFFTFMLAFNVLFAASTYHASRSIHQGVALAQQQIQNKQYQQARQGLEKLLPEAKSAYEQALIQQTLGYAALGQQAENAARQAFTHALRSEALPPAVNQDLRRLTGQLLLKADKAQAALTLLRRWRQAAGKLKAADHVLFAHTYSRLQEMDKAAWHWQQAIQKTSQPPQQWYEQLLNAYLKTKQVDKAIPVIKALLEKKPGHLLYWQHLVQLYLQQGHHTDALAALSLAQRQGILDSTDLDTLMQLYLSQQQPTAAATLLEHALAEGKLADKTSHWRWLALAWEQARAREKAITAWERVGNSAESVEHRLHLLLQLQHWQHAKILLQQASTQLTQHKRTALQAYLAQF